MSSRWMIGLSLALAGCAASNGAGNKPSTGGEPTPPTEVGVSASSVTGCLASSEREQSESRAAPEPAPAPASAPGAAAGVSVTLLPDGVRVRHALSHACCLQSQIATSIESNRVRITETLSGEACRCMCESSISTAVHLSPGHYELEVVLDDRGHKSVASHQSIDVK